ncbi:MAG: HAD family hydrolase [Bacteroidota bacterium]
MNIRAVFFDMGGTIETFWYTRALRLEQTPGIQGRLASAGIRLDLTTEQLFEVVASGLQRYHAWSLESMQELPPERVWSEYIFAALPVGRTALAAIAEDLMYYVETRYFEREMRPEIPTVLEAICQMGFKIGLISNVNSRGQVPANLMKYHIRHYFDPIVLSSEYGRRKPDPAIFHYAARLAGVPTSACLYVGDRIARDIVGARKAGFGLAVQICHAFEHGEPDEGATPDLVIHQMTELLDVLRAARRRDESSSAPEPRSLRAILFDAGDILYHRPGKARRLKAFLEEVVPGAPNPPGTARELLTERAYRGQIDQQEYLEGLLRLYGITRPEQIERGRQIIEQEDSNVQFFPGVPETLMALKAQGYLLGIVTDTANSVHAKLSWFESGGFGHVWDSIISSKELGRRKPEPEIYRASLEQLGVSPAEAVFVGHKAYELEGARAVGIRTVAFNYDTDADADYFIDKFSDLLNVPIISAKG